MGVADHCTAQSIQSMAVLPWHRLADLIPHWLMLYTVCPPHLDDLVQRLKVLVVPGWISSSQDVCPPTRTLWHIHMSLVPTHQIRFDKGHATYITLQPLAFCILHIATCSLFLHLAWRLESDCGAMAGRQDSSQARTLPYQPSVSALHQLSLE